MRQRQIDPRFLLALFDSRRKLISFAIVCRKRELFAVTIIAARRLVSEALHSDLDVASCASRQTSDVRQLRCQHNRRTRKSRLQELEHCFLVALLVLRLDYQNILVSIKLSVVAIIDSGANTCQHIARLVVEYDYSLVNEERVNFVIVVLVALIVTLRSFLARLQCRVSLDCAKLRRIVVIVVTLNILLRNAHTLDSLLKLRDRNLYVDAIVVLVQALRELARILLDVLLYDFREQT